MTAYAWLAFVAFYIFITWPRGVREMKNWDSYLMGFAEHAASGSKDSTKVGAALVNDGKFVLLTGFNGPPQGVADRPERFERPAKYLYTVHAEKNLIGLAAKRGIRTAGCSVYVTHHPCATCATLLIQAGICEVVYGPGTTSMPREEFDVAREVLHEAGVKVRGLHK